MSFRLIHFVLFSLLPSASSRTPQVALPRYDLPTHHQSWELGARGTSRRELSRTRGESEMRRGAAALYDATAGGPIRIVIHVLHHMHLGRILYPLVQAQIHARTVWSVFGSSLSKRRIVLL